MTLTLSFRIDAGAIAAQDQHSLAVARLDHQAAVYPGTYYALMPSLNVLTLSSFSVWHILPAVCFTLLLLS